MKTILLGLLPLRTFWLMAVSIVIGALGMSASVMFIGWYLQHTSSTTATTTTTGSVKTVNIKPQSTVLEGLMPEQLQMLKAKRDAMALPAAEPLHKKKKWAE